MATTELTRADVPRLPGGLRRAWLEAYAAIWAATLGTTLLVSAVALLEPPVRHLLRLRLQANETPAPRLGHIVSLTAHNLPITAWPVLLGALGVHRRHSGRRVADILVVACIGANVLPVGAALGAYGSRLLPYIPQLPFEWAALAFGASAWLLQRHQPLSITQGIALATLIAVLLLCAATMETLAVPHGRRSSPTTARVPRNWQGGLHTSLRDVSSEPTFKELENAASGQGRPETQRRTAR
jgi:hypothetical protein